MLMSPPICMVLLPAPARFEAKAVRAALAGAFPPEAEAQVNHVSDDGETLTLSIDGRLHTVMCLPAPIPADSFATTLRQPGIDALRALAEHHGAHLIVTCMEPGEEMGEAVVAAATTHMLAACLGRMHGAVAGYWSPSERLCDWSEFEGYAAAMAPVLTEGDPAFPTRYWVSVQLTQDGEKYGGTTMGLMPFTNYEIDLTPIPWPMEEVAGRLVGVVTYLFSAGPVLKDGDTLGMSETERFRINAKFESMILTFEMTEL